LREPFPTLSIAAIVGDIVVRALSLLLVAIVDGVTALADVTPAELPEATSLPPPQEAKAMTEVAQTKRRLIGVFI
jgi:hypothetical protein